MVTQRYTEGIVEFLLQQFLRERATFVRCLTCLFIDYYSSSDAEYSGKVVLRELQI